MTLATIPGYDPDRVNRIGGRAVVVGTSMAGMLAALVLADRYETVTVLDRDELPDRSVAWRGVPQGTQIHALQEATWATIEDLFPGFGYDLQDTGGVVVRPESFGLY